METRRVWENIQEHSSFCPCALSVSVLAAPESLHFAEWSWELGAGGARGCGAPEPSWVGRESQFCPVLGEQRGGFLQSPLGGSGIGPWLLWE